MTTAGLENVIKDKAKETTNINKQLTPENLLLQFEGVNVHGSSVIIFKLVLLLIVASKVNLFSCS